MAITLTALTSGESDVDATSQATASITPGANRLVLATITTQGGGPPATPTATGNGLTWVQVATVTYNTVADPFKRITLFRAMGSAPSAGAVTFDFGAETQVRFAWSVVESNNEVDTGGTNGSAAVVQSATNNANAVTSLTVTLAAFGSANNATYGAFGISVIEVQAPGAGFTEIHDIGPAAETIRIHTEWRSDNDTTVDQSSVTAADRGGIAIEIKAAATPGGSGSLRAGGSSRIIDFGWLVGGGQPALQWQPFINRTNDSQSHEPLEANADLFPILLLNPAVGTLFIQTLTVVAVGVAAISDAAIFVKSLPATAVGVATMTDIVTFMKTLAATAIGVATLTRIATFLRTLDAVAVGIAVLQKKMFTTLSATAVGVASMAQVSTYARTLAVTAVGVATLTTAKIVLQTLAATAAGIAGLATLFIPGGGGPGAAAHMASWVSQMYDRVRGRR